MNILLLIIPIAMFLGLFFLFGFIRAVSQGQYDDLETPPLDILNDHEIERTANNDKQLRFSYHKV